MSARWPRGLLFTQWLVFAALVAFGTYLAAELGLVARLVQGDITRLSILILLLLLGGLLHGAWRAATLSRELDVIDDLAVRFERDRDAAPLLALGAPGTGTTSLVHAYLGAVALAAGRGAEESSQNLTDVFNDRVHAPYEFGWFLTNLSIRLGLLGTVIGFILMLRSAVVIDSIEFSTVQSLLSEMTQGMGVALNTTLVGLVVSAVLSVQYLWLDFGARRLVSDTVFFAERDLKEGFAASAPAPASPAG
ncbi:MAG: MotA/TolQ/ExbB proton channel family protein [Pseudomonadota bacterium]